LAFYLVRRLFLYAVVAALVVFVLFLLVHSGVDILGCNERGTEEMTTPPSARL
jgi:hypothetical protein